MLGDLRFAVGFLTRVPMGDVAPRDEDDPVARSVPWFPIVGAMIGLAQGGVIHVVSERATPTVAAMLGVAVALLATGAFHHDGLADIADAFGGGWTIEQRFEILKDSRLGTYGTASLCIAIIGEITVIAALVPVAAGSLPAIIWVMVAAQAMSRSVAVAAMAFAPVAGDGLGAGYARSVGPMRATAAVAIGVGLWVGILGIDAIGPMVLGGFGGLAVVALAIRKIGGITGDVLGATQVISHLGLLLGLALI